VSSTWTWWLRASSSSVAGPRWPVSPMTNRLRRGPRKRPLLHSRCAHGRSEVAGRPPTDRPPGSGVS
jgi:hypothetical protein